MELFSNPDWSVWGKNGMATIATTIPSNLPVWEIPTSGKQNSTNLPDWQPANPTSTTQTQEDQVDISSTGKSSQTQVESSDGKSINLQNGTKQLTTEQQQVVDKDKATDRAVRAHEQAHLAAAGSLAISGANFSYVTGPDGVRYAVSGDVTIDTSAVPNDPEATYQKAQEIIRAALAPAQPSPQDLSVAAQAQAMAAQAMQELMKQKLAAASGIDRSQSIQTYQAYLRPTNTTQPFLVDVQA
jgi:hypothetical protein